jgi:hypothetical protein
MRVKRDLEIDLVRSKRDLLLITWAYLLSLNYCSGVAREDCRAEAQ